MEGKNIKDELVDLFDESTEIINRSEDVDRNQMSEDTIQKYLYEKLEDTSVTILLLTPEAVSYKKDWYGEYDDWLYDELRYWKIELIIEQMVWLRYIQMVLEINYL